MTHIIHVRISRGDTHYIAECADLPVVTQAATLDELTTNITEAITLHLDGENLSELGLVDQFTILASMELPVVA